MKLKIIQKGFNYSQDGPGNRLVYHLQGCNLRCPWCANPEGVSPSGTRMHVDGRDKLSYTEYSLEEILDEAARSSPMFFESGGVTLTGGEPTMQYDAVLSLLRGLKELKIHTALENNATHPGLLKLLPYVDYLMADFKHPDTEAHQKATGMGNEMIRENLSAILRSGRQLHLRIPLVNGFNTYDAALRGFLSFFTDLPCSQAVFEFLCYHEYGRDKWTQCGMEYKMRDAFVPPETLAKFESAFRSRGLRVVRT